MKISIASSIVVGLGLCCANANAAAIYHDAQSLQQLVERQLPQSFYAAGSIIRNINAAWNAINNVANGLSAAGTEMASLQYAPADVIRRTIMRIMPEAALYKRTVENGTEVIREGAKRAKAQFGPYKLVGKNDYRPSTEMMTLDPRGQGRVSYLPAGSLCDGKDCTILSARISMTFANGSEANPDNGVYVHHLLSFVPLRPSVQAVGLCDVPDPSKSLGPNGFMPVRVPFSPFTGRGEDGGPVAMKFTSGDGGYNSGFHMGKNDMLIVQSDLVNYSNQTQEVYLTYDYEYVDGLQGDMAVTVLLSVTGCLLVVPPKINATGRAVTVSRKFPIMADATLVNLRGHMHDGGDSMIFSVNNKTVCESMPQYKGRELWSMSACGEPVDVKKGDYVTLTSIYDVTKHPLREGVVAHSHGGTATNVFGLQDLMGMYAVTYATKPGA